MGVPRLHEGSRPWMQSKAWEWGKSRLRNPTFAPQLRVGEVARSVTNTSRRPPFKCQPPYGGNRRGNRERLLRISLRSPLPSPRSLGPSGESIEIPAFGAALHEVAEPENTTGPTPPRQSRRKVSARHFGGSLSRTRRRTLTAKQQRFVEEYLVDLNATRGRARRRLQCQERGQDRLAVGREK